MQLQLRKSAIGNASTGVMATLHPMPTIRRGTATIRLPPHTLIRHLSMATNRRRLCILTLRPTTAIKHLRPPVVETIHPPKAMATIRPPVAETTHPPKATIRPQMETSHHGTTTPAIIPRMALGAGGNVERTADANPALGSTCRAKR